MDREKWEQRCRADHAERTRPRFVRLEALPCRKCGSTMRLLAATRQMRIGADEPANEFLVCDRGCPPDKY